MLETLDLGVEVIERDIFRFPLGFIVEVVELNFHFFMSTNETKKNANTLRSYSARSRS